MASPQPGGLRRVVVAAADASPAPASLSPYEVERAARVARNQQTMAALGVTKAAAALSAPAVWRRAKPGNAGGGGERRAKRPAEAVPEPPARVSKRLRVRAGLAEPEPDGSASELDAGVEAEDDRPRMLTVDEFLERKGLPKGMRSKDATPSAACTPAPAAPVPYASLTAAHATGATYRRPRRCAPCLRLWRRADSAARPAPGPLMTGHFTGWVEESVRQSLGLRSSAAVRRRGARDTLRVA